MLKLLSTVKYRIRNTGHAKDYKISVFVQSHSRGKGCVDSQSQVCDAVEVSVTSPLFM